MSMRKKIIYLFITILFNHVIFFVSPSILMAQTPASCPPAVPSVAPIFGINCGNPLDPCNNKCCYSAPDSGRYIQIHPLLKPVEDLVNEKMKDKINPILEFKRQVNMAPCVGGSPSIPGDLGNPACVCLTPTPATLSALVNLCSRIQNGGERSSCENCLNGSGPGGYVGVWTSIGCVSSNIGGFIQNTMLTWGIGFAGGISLLCIMYAAFMMQTSSGNPEKIKKAQQLMTSCIMGLMLILFSVFILRLIGVTILKIPGFN